MDSAVTSPIWVALEALEKFFSNRFMMLKGKIYLLTCQRGGTVLLQSVF